MAIVLNPNDHITPKGIITLEDVMEELLQEEIFDEDDWRRQQAYHDVRLAKAFLPRKYPCLLPPLFSTPQRLPEITRKIQMLFKIAFPEKLKSNVKKDFFLDTRRYSLANVPRKQSLFIGHGGPNGGPNGGNGGLSQSQNQSQTQNQLPYPNQPPYPLPPGYMAQAPAHIRQRSMSHVPSHTINLASSQSIGRRDTYVSPTNTNHPQTLTAPPTTQAGGGGVGGGGGMGVGGAGVPPVVHPNAHINNPSEQTPLLGSGKS
jgi:hypothetical protein